MSVTAPSTGNSVTITRTIKAPPQRVFDAWTSPEEMKRWKAPGDMSTDNITIDLRVGGRYRIPMRSPDGAERVVSGVYREIDAPRRLVYTWLWETSPGFPETVVTVEFVAIAAGTEVRVTHAGLPDDDAKMRHQQGWTGSLDKLVFCFA